MKKTKKVFFQWIVLIGCVLILLMVGNIIYQSVGSVKPIEAEKFRAEGNYTDEELLLFVDLVFWDDRIILKWEEDIRVEIKNIKDVTAKEIAEVDSAIAIYAPLVYPLKMYRVPKDGNLLVHRRVESIDIDMDVRGLCRINPSPLDKGFKLKRVETYDLSPYHSPATFLHEFEHALGLSHPSKQYPFYMIIGSREAPYVFKSFEEMDKYLDMPFYVSEEEKKVIKMLYSPYIRSGLKKSVFMKKMGLHENH